MHGDAAARTLGTQFVREVPQTEVVTSFDHLVDNGDERCLDSNLFAEHAVKRIGAAAA